MSCYKSNAYLGCSEKDVFSDMSDFAADHSEGDSREDVGVVSLARVECLTIHSHCLKWASTGKDALALKIESLHDFSYSYMIEIQYLFKKFNAVNIISCT